MSVNVGNMPPQIQQRYNQKLLSTPERNCIHKLFASYSEMPDNSGFIERQSRYERLDLFPVPLGDAQLNPAPQLLNRVDVDCRLRNYMTYLVLTRQLTITNEDPVLNAGTARLGQAMRETQDVLVRDELEGTASIINCVGGTNGDLPTEMAVSDIDDIVTVMQNNDGDYITNINEAKDKFGTAPVGDSYGMLSTTRMIPVFNNIQGYIRKFQYPNIDKTLESEWGAVNNVRMFVSSQGSVTPNASLLGNDVANNFVVAQEAYKVVTQTSGKGRIIYRPPGYGEDPGMLRHNLAAVFYQGQCVKCLRISNLVAHFKSLLIDLEAYDYAEAA